MGVRYPDVPSMTDPNVPDESSPSNLSATSRSPTEVRDHDPGDATQLNFAYQYGYGVILLAAAARGELPYITLWCEHHEDLLCERTDGLFDAYQIKTRQPERGPWQLIDDDFSKSIRRFVSLEKQYPGWIHKFSFVSNARCSDSEAKDKIGLSPLQLLRAVAAAPDGTELHADTEKNAKLCAALSRLASTCDCTEDVLMAVLKRVGIIEGPPRQGFEAVVAHNHLGMLSQSRHLPPEELSRLRDEVMHRIALASSLRNVDPARHWSPVHGNDQEHPELLAKQVSLTAFQAMLSDRPEVPFQFVAGPRTFTLGGAVKGASVLAQKLTRGGLGEHVTVMQTRAFSAERHLMELAYRKPDTIDDTLNQLSELVLGTCLEAKLQAEQGGGVYGPRMLSEVYTRIRADCAERPAMYDKQQPECLLGIVGLLTGECLIWWSEKFTLEAVS